jgi:hypothetical protein
MGSEAARIRIQNDLFQILIQILIRPKVRKTLIFTIL